MSAHPLSAIDPVSSFEVIDNDSIIPLVAEQERLARFKSFNSAQAWELGNAIRNLYIERYGENKKLGAIISIQLWSGHTLFSAVVGDAPFVGPDNWVWAQGKMNVVKRVHKSSLRVGRELAKSGREPEQKGLNFPEYACHGGGFPLWVKGIDVGPIGAILVSGLPQLDDHQLIVDAIASVPHLLAAEE